MGIEVVAFAVVRDVLPRRLNAHGSQQVWEPIGVRREEEKHVLMLAGVGATVTREVEGCALRCAVLGLPRMRVFRAKNDECRSLAVVDLSRTAGQAVDTGEVATIFLLDDPIAEL